MGYYRTCPRCGVHLDPGERCDCRGNEKALASAANADEGRVEQIATAVSTSNNT